MRAKLHGARVMRPARRRLPPATLPQRGAPSKSIAAQFADARDAAATLAEQTADAIARLLLDSLAAAFPVLCASCGEVEVQAIVRSVLPALNQEQAVTVRTNPLTARSLLREVGRLDPDFAARVQIVECNSMTPGDVLTSR